MARSLHALPCSCGDMVRKLYALCVLLFVAESIISKENTIGVSDYNYFFKHYGANIKFVRYLTCFLFNYCYKNSLSKYD